MRLYTVIILSMRRFACKVGVGNAAVRGLRGQRVRFAGEVTVLSDMSISVTVYRLWPRRTLHLMAHVSPLCISTMYGSM